MKKPHKDKAPSETHAMFRRFGLREGRDFSPERVEWNPPIDMYETEKQVMVYVEMPGMNEEDISITFKSNVLTIEGEKKKIVETGGHNFYCLERSFGAFRRSFHIRVPIDKSKIKATYHLGTLKIELPKKK